MHVSSLLNVNVKFIQSNDQIKTVKDKKIPLPTDV